MDKDQSQMNQHGSLHHERDGEVAHRQFASEQAEEELQERHAAMDAMEARLFAMARSRS